MQITVVDYNSSNLLSVCRAFTHCGANVKVSKLPTEIENADRLILPGVGAFGNSMNSVDNAGLSNPIRNFIATGRPFLGICVGMQMMMDSSHEFGHHKGLGVISGGAEAIPRRIDENRSRKIPHIGWAEIQQASAETRWKGTILDKCIPGDAAYFVHSYTVWPKDERHRLADVDYDGYQISAVIKRDNAYGCQFHPEKSGVVGLRILSNFLHL